ncbi:MAG: YciK family oxidoreductase [Pseudomonadales bacterium]|nr:YciK family oxidoreductase [Pseudomonadales bacterium]
MFDYQASPQCLQAKVILITGASEGIGRAMALSFAAAGATVLLNGRNIARLESLYDEIVGAGFAEPAICPMDLSSQHYEDYIVLQNSIGETFGRLDGLLHNAGVLGRINPIANTLTQDWLKVMQTNLNAPFFLTKAMLPLLEEAEHGSIVFVSSGVGRQGRANWGAYAASKFGTEGLMQVLSDELDTISNIRVNSLNPGATNTAMRRMAFPGEMASSNPSPASIAAAFLFLMSDDSIGVTGQALNAQQGAAADYQPAVSDDRK